MLRKNTRLSIKYRIADHDLDLTLAQTLEEKSQGLIGTKKLNDNQGMLFIYDEGQEAKFWMKDMSIPIDLIWLSRDKVVDFEKNIQPDNGEKLYFSPGEIDGVLEVRAGWIDQYGVKLGDKLEKL
ncbi:DUF192 domain-containing protein [Candidatus Berkelbacteria bacterium]|nr:DUF192 domain-containing protein [Candidatus Berkelbacteria bacterium]